jgi:dihydrodipicolinate reductase
MIRVLVNGALGRMGSEVVKKVCAEADLELAAVVDVKEASITLDTGAVMTTQTDLEAAYDGDPAAFNKAEIILCYPGMFAVMVNRIAHELHLLNVPIIPRMMT